MDSPLRSVPAPDTPDLRAAIRLARIEDAERSGVLAELRGAEQSRLETLQGLLAPVFAQLPREAELFDQGLVPGEKPRLYVDMIAFVEMGRDKRRYRFVQDTRAGRMILAESDEPAILAEAVTAYLGRRLVEREKALAGLSPLLTPEPQDNPALPEKPVGYTLADTIFAFVMGMIAGAALFFAYAWLKAAGTLPPLP